MIKLINFVNIYKTCSEDRFLEQYPHPILLIEKQQTTAPKMERKSERTLSFDTSFGENQEAITTLNGRRPGIVPTKLSLVFSLNEAVEEQVYLISIGRSTQSYICLKDSALSKFHAFFKHDADDWFVADGGSSNGSRYNGKKMAPNEPYLLKSNDGIMLSQVYLCTFFYPKDFYEYVLWLGKEVYIF